MEKIKISRIEAYSKFVEGDFEVMDEELERLYFQSKEFGKVQTMDFHFLPGRDVILLEVLWDEDLVYEITFG